jgi:GNAT superfamily N-acetyltransferase
MVHRRRTRAEDFAVGLPLTSMSPRRRRGRVTAPALHGEGWDPSLARLADADGEVVGFIVPFFFRTYGYVGILGVLKPWRGRGIAKALLRRSFAELRQPGCRSSPTERRRSERPWRRPPLRRRRDDCRSQVRPPRPRDGRSRSTDSVTG